MFLKNKKTPKGPKYSKTPLSNDLTYVKYILLINEIKILLYIKLKKPA
jgi:hypothetical protein